MPQLWQIGSADTLPYQRYLLFVKRGLAAALASTPELLLSFSRSLNTWLSVVTFVVVFDRLFVY